MSKKRTLVGGGGVMQRGSNACLGVIVGSTAWSSRLATTRNVIFRVDFGMHCITCVQECTPFAVKLHRHQQVRHMKHVLLQRRASSY